MPSYKLQLDANKDLTHQLENIPPGTKTIRLVFDNPPSSEYLREVINRIPATPHLNLSLLSLSELYDDHGGDDFISIFESLAQDEPKSLDLSGNALFHLLESGLVRLFNTFSPSLENLSLSGNQLYKLSPGQLAEAFKSLPTHIQVINLNGNFKKTYSGNRLIAVLNNLHTNIISLDISNNSLFNKDESRLHIMELLYSKQLEHLNLSRNFNGYFQSKLIVEMFYYLPPTLISLTVSNSSILHMRKTDMIEAFSKFPPTLQKLDISGHSVKSGTTTSHQQLEKLISALKQTNVYSINLGDGEAWKSHPMLLMELVSVLAKNCLRNLSGSASLKLKTLLKLMTEPFSSIVTLFGNDQATTSDLRYEYLQLFKTTLGFNLPITPELIELIYKQQASQLSVARYTLFSSKRNVLNLKKALSLRAKSKLQGASAMTLHIIKNLEMHTREDQCSGLMPHTRRATVV